MRAYHRTIGISLPLAALVMLFSGISTSGAAEDIIGEWEFTMSMGDGGGMGGEMHPTSVFTKAEDGTITGTWEMNFQPPEGAEAPPGGDFQMPAFKLVNVKIDGQNLTFTQSGDMGGQAFEMPFVGTIKGDKIEGSFSGQFGEMAITGERKKSENLVGDWEFNMTVGGGGGGMGMEMQFVIDSTFSKNDEGAYTATWDQQMQPMEGAEAPEGGFGPPGGGMGTMDVKISNIKLEGNKLTFTQNVSMGDMAFASDFSGTIEGDAITGTLSSEMGGDIPLTGKRKTADPLSGNWAFEMNFSGGGAGGGGGMGMDMQFVIDATFSKDDAGAYTATWDQQMKPAEGADAAEGGFGPPGGGMGGMGAMEVTVSDIKLDGNKLTFTREVSMGDTPFQSDFSGTIEGDTITGTISSEMTGEIPLTGKRKAE